MKRGSPLKRSPIKRRSSKPIPKVNHKRKVKRKIAYRKMLAGKEYQVARDEAFVRAGHQCEAMMQIAHPLKPSKSLGLARCGVVDPLQAHHLRYPKSRPVEARDLLIVCKEHHEYLESQKMHKQRMF